MDNTAAPSPNSSLNALRGAVGGVLGAAGAVGCWDQLVSIWRIFWALDGLIAVLWAIVDRLRAGDELVGGGCPAGAAWDERPVVAGSGPVRRRAVAGVRAVSGRRVLTGAVASVGRVRRGARARVDWGRRGRVLGRISPVLAVRCRLFSELGWGASRNCVLIVPDG
jgi:hypothetical protein